MAKANQRRFWLSVEEQYPVREYEVSVFTCNSTPDDNIIYVYIYIFIHQVMVASKKKYIHTKIYKNKYESRINNM